jgi:signal transduction histidine kinase
MKARETRPPSRRGAPLRPLLGFLALIGLALPLALVILVRLFIGSSEPGEPFSRFVRSAQMVRSAVREEAGGGIAAAADFVAPQGFDLVVADASGLVIVSSLGQLPAGSRAGQAEIAAKLAALFPARALYEDTVESGGRKAGTTWVLMPPTDLRRVADPAFRLIPILALGGMALFAFLAGALVAAHLAREVLRLERAAGRIAAGDLESPIPARGVREIRGLARAMDAMRLALREDLARRGRFLAAVSHDLRTPLTSIGGYLEAVEDGLAEDPATLDRYVAIMRDKTRLLESRIGGLIDFARMETEEWRLGFERVELASYLSGLAREFAEDAALLGRRFSAELSAVGNATAELDRALLARALENLVSNALRFSPPGGEVRLSSSRSPSGLVMVIDDEGPGIPAEERERVFEPFYRGSSAREGEGSGLGLYIARSILRGHGWDLRAASAPGGGGRIIIEMGMLEPRGPGRIKTGT